MTSKDGFKARRCAFDKENRTGAAVRELGYHLAEAVDVNLNQVRVSRDDLQEARHQENPQSEQAQYHYPDDDGRKDEEDQRNIREACNLIVAGQTDRDGQKDDGQTKYDHGQEDLQPDLPRVGVCGDRVGFWQRSILRILHIDILARYAQEDNQATEAISVESVW